MTANSTDGLILGGLDGDNPLGFLAALGILVVLHRAGNYDARLGWKRISTWQPELTGIGLNDADSLAECLVELLRGTEVSNDAELQRKGSEQQFNVAKKALRKKQDEIKERHLSRDEYKGVVEKEIPPLEETLRKKRKYWLSALRQAIPRAELALGKRIDCTVGEFREHTQNMLDDSAANKRDALDLLAAFGSDACVDEKSLRILSTPFCFITGSGHQYFLDTVRELIKRVTVDRVRSALFEPWTYPDEKFSMRWDPVEDRRYALMAEDPTAPGNRARTVWMANLLAYHALTLFPSMPQHGKLMTTGWTSDKSNLTFTWPIWDHPADLNTIHSLVQLSDLVTLKRDSLRSRGIAEIFRAPRIKVGSGANFKVNFGLPTVF